MVDRQIGQFFVYPVADASVLAPEPQSLRIRFVKIRRFDLIFFEFFLSLYSLFKQNASKSSRNKRKSRCFSNSSNMRRGIASILPIPFFSRKLPLLKPRLQNSFICRHQSFPTSIAMASFVENNGKATQRLYRTLCDVGHFTFSILFAENSFFAAKRLFRPFSPRYFAQYPCSCT